MKQSCVVNSKSGRMNFHLSDFIWFVLQHIKLRQPYIRNATAVGDCGDGDDGFGRRTRRCYDQMPAPSPAALQG